MEQAAEIDGHSRILSRMVFYLGTVYFSLHAAFSLQHYQLNFILDGFGLVFDIVNDQRFPDGVQREVMWLGQLIPVTLSLLGAKLKYIMLSYVLNVYLLYYLVFLAIVLWLKDGASALFYLFMHMYGHLHNYFFIVTELLPAVLLLVFALAILKSERKSASVTILSLFLTLLVTRSHPLAALCMLIALGIFFLFDRNIIKKKKLQFGLSALALVVGLSIKFFSLNHYDTAVLDKSKSISTAFFELLNPVYLTNVGYYLAQSCVAFTVIFLLTVALLFAERNYKLLLALLFVMAACAVLLNLMLDFSHFNVWDITELRNDRWSLPIKFSVFLVFFYFCLKQLLQPATRTFLLPFLVLLLFLGFPEIFKAQQKAALTIQQFHSMIETAKKEGCRKCIVDSRQYNVHAYFHGESFFDALILSSLESPDTSVQIVFAPPEKMQEVLALPAERIKLMDFRYIYNEQELNKKYFNLPVEQYRLLNYTGNHRKP